ncbi:Uncharacterised protein [Klebsiella pneumoniae]|nr:Uncharacterised protein [Klebsiella pneumoniae]
MVSITILPYVLQQTGLINLTDIAVGCWTGLVEDNLALSLR